MVSISQQSALTNLNSSIIRAIPLLLPPLPEQRRIAELLDTVDEAIRKTEEIAKLKQVKQGLLHDLLTRGIDDNGELRDADLHPEQFKDSPLGRIPKAWEVVPVAGLCSEVVDCPHSTPAYVPEGIPAIRTADIVPGELLLDQAYRVDQETYLLRVARLEPQAGDVIYSREGGRLGIAGSVGTERVCMAQRVMLLRPSKETDSTFLVWAMNSAPFLAQVFAMVGASASPHVNVGDVASFLVPRPDTAEQEAIGAVLGSHQKRVVAEQRELEKLRTLKHGLMKDLLTGRVRVTPLLEEAAE